MNEVKLRKMFSFFSWKSLLFFFHFLDNKQDIRTNSEVKMKYWTQFMLMEDHSFGGFLILCCRS